jgi:hypothetical protein
MKILNLIQGKRTFLILLICLGHVKIQGQAKKSVTVKPLYTGTVEYSSGGFGGYDYPTEGDSVLVYTEGDNLTALTVFRKEKKEPRHLDISFRDLILIRKKEYIEIIAPGKSAATGSYDMKFSYGQKWTGGNKYTITISNFGDGTSAQIVVTGGDEIRFNDVLIAKLVKVK